jgi:2-oxoglutarate ferredoxin oxidoreductase subunit delta
VSATYAQQLGNQAQPPIARTLPAGDIKEWSPAKPARHPLSPQQTLKLRDVDIFIIEDRCKGCSFCIEFCPRKVLEEDEKLNKIGIHPPRVKDSSLCVGCGVCEDICPDFAIYLVDKEGPR